MTEFKGEVEIKDEAESKTFITLDGNKRDIVVYDDDAKERIRIGYYAPSAKERIRSTTPPIAGYAIRIMSSDGEKIIDLNTEGDFGLGGAVEPVDLF